MWKAMGQTHQDDRSADHLAGFDNYQQLPPYLGHVLEVGCGPWTQLGFLLDQRRNWIVDNITLWEPGADAYVRDVATCAYKDGNLRGRPVNIVSKGAEAIVDVEKFDTIVIINVLEHVQDMYAVLGRIYAALKPGGILIFADRWWDAYDFQTKVGPGGPDNSHLDRLYHPIRCSRKVFEHFLSKFASLHKAVDHVSMTKYKGRGVYFIGMKLW